MRLPFRSAIPCALFLASVSATAQIEVVAIVNQDHYKVTQPEIALADMRPLGTVCTHKNQCQNSFCYEFGPSPLANACSHTCNTAAVCQAVPGKVAKCRKRRLDIPTTGNSCFYVPGPL